MPRDKGEYYLWITKKKCGDDGVCMGICNDDDGKIRDILVGRQQLLLQLQLQQPRTVECHVYVSAQ